MEKETIVDVAAQPFGCTATLHKYFVTAPRLIWDTLCLFYITFKCFFIICVVTMKPATLTAIFSKMETE